MPKKPAQMNGEMRLRRNGKGERDATHPHTHTTAKSFFALHDARGLSLMREGGLG